MSQSGGRVESLDPPPPPYPRCDTAWFLNQAVSQRGCRKASPRHLTWAACVARAVTPRLHGGRNGSHTGRSPRQWKCDGGQSVAALRRPVRPVSSARLLMPQSESLSILHRIGARLLESQSRRERATTRIVEISKNEHAGEGTRHTPAQPGLRTLAPRAKQLHSVSLSRGAACPLANRLPFGYRSAGL